MQQPKQRGAAADRPSARYFRELKQDLRTPAQRDRDRVLYAAAFARLAEITQVISPELGYVFHNRLTHSIKVAQIARRMAERMAASQPKIIAAIGGIDPEAAEAAGLAHDLGHPPFGHIAEDELNRLVRDAGVKDGFEGNAQSFRIVTQLATSDARDQHGQPLLGLNWTRQTLDGILKYPWGYGENPSQPKKWGYYQTEKDIFDWVRRGRVPRQRSLISELMDWADDITYAIHDLTDFFRAGRIPLDRFKGNRAERDRFLERVFGRKLVTKREQRRYAAALDAIIDVFPFEPEERYSDSQEHRAELYGFTTTLIAQYVAAIRARRPTKNDPSLVSVEPKAKDQIAILKQFIWEYILKIPALPFHNRASEGQSEPYSENSHSRSNGGSFSSSRKGSGKDCGRSAVMHSKKRDSLQTTSPV